MISDSPMHSSAYLTTFPSSDLATSDLAAVDSRMDTPRQDSSAGIPVGLLPQLIDVLHALTEGQHLLSYKIRSARRVEPQAEQGEPISIPAGHSLVRDGSADVVTPLTAPSRDKLMDEQAAPLTVHSVGRSAESGVEASGVEHPLASFPDSLGLLGSPEVTNTDVTLEPSSDAAVQSAPLNPVTLGAPSTSPLRRDYNFFDELDARLASLRDPTA